MATKPKKPTRCEWCAGRDWPLVEWECGHALCVACSRGECPVCVLEKREQVEANDG